MDGVQHVDQCIRRVGIVHDGGETFGRAHRVEASGHRVQGAQGHQYVFFLLAQQYGSAEYSQQVGGIEASDEVNGYFVVIEVEQHAFEV